MLSHRSSSVFRVIPFQVSIRKQTEKVEPEELNSDKKKTNKGNTSDDSAAGTHRWYRSHQRRQCVTHEGTSQGMRSIGHIAVPFYCNKI